MEENKTDQIRIHRVGTITCGIVLILYGIMFLVHIFLPIIKYVVILEMWPAILVILGLEILISCIGSRKEQVHFVYDFPAVILILLLALFAIVMGVLDYAVQSGAVWVQDGGIWYVW